MSLVLFYACCLALANIQMLSKIPIRRSFPLFPFSATSFSHLLPFPLPPSPTSPFPPLPPSCLWSLPFPFPFLHSFIPSLKSPPSPPPPPHLLLKLILINFLLFQSEENTKSLDYLFTLRQSFCRL